VQRNSSGIFVTKGWVAFRMPEGLKNLIVKNEDILQRALIQAQLSELSGVFKLHFTNEYQVAIDNDHPYINIRQNYLNKKSGEWHPSPKGVTVSPEDMEFFVFKIKNL
jgi:hypothetical protein